MDSNDGPAGSLYQSMSAIISMPWNAECCSCGGGQRAQQARDDHIEPMINIHVVATPDDDLVSASHAESTWNYTVAEEEEREGNPNQGKKTRKAKKSKVLTRNRYIIEEVLAEKEYELSQPHRLG